ncbi:unnamed protein product [Linum tenue]|uniref:Uncharacterized protein n=1 Tax=Linum tenue TaxID=586396 RepID=A0AAV0S2F1_9ROSI|nr:unnamed protein product [Linum tenue]
MEKAGIKFIFFFALLLFIAGTEMRVAEGRGPIVSFRCSEAKECAGWCIAAECQVCACSNHKCICNANALNQIMNPPSLAH